MAFRFAPGPLEGLVLVQPELHTDRRGTFVETFRSSAFAEEGLPARFVQENLSVSTVGVLRGIHFQTGPHAQGKLVRAVEGRVWDLAVDLRPESPTFACWYGLELSGQNQTMVYLPPGFGHGTLALSERVVVMYLCTAEYNAASEGGVRWDDPRLAIEWPRPAEFVVSEKDQALPYLDAARRAK
jgi:dTDP-4-dehydrorhamnose 3,5-epimerase